MYSLRVKFRLVYHIGVNKTGVNPKIWYRDRLKWQNSRYEFIIDVSRLAVQAFWDNDGNMRYFILSSDNNLEISQEIVTIEKQVCEVCTSKIEILRATLIKSMVLLESSCSVHLTWCCRILWYVNLLVSSLIIAHPLVNLFRFSMNGHGMISVLEQRTSKFCNWFLELHVCHFRKNTEV